MTPPVNAVGIRSQSTGVAPYFSAAVVGGAGIGAVHMRELAAGGCSKLLVAGRSLASAEATAGRLSGELGRQIESVDGLAGLLEHPVDFISVCSPTELHAAHCHALSPTGAFLLVEKPFFWTDPISEQDVEMLANELFEKAEGRLAVNHPTGFLAESFAASQGPLPPLRDFVFSYRTRGRYQGKMIAVDLLPHALSALLTLAGSSNSPIEAPRQLFVSQEAARWHMEFMTGETRCRFDFEQDPAQHGSSMSFAYNGLKVNREQEAVTNGFRVFLATSDKRFEIPNPMTVSVQRALSAARSGVPVPGESAYVIKIMTFMAALLSG